MSPKLQLPSAVPVVPKTGRTKYDTWTREQLVVEVARLRKRKKYGLVFEGKPEDVAERCKIELPVLREVAANELVSDKNLPTNVLIEGDNYHGVSVLNYTHKGKIDLIYIDPPYNTGARDWKYNNDYVDAEDTYRHTKWLSFMSHRLKLAKNLLTKDGIICVAIDDHELFTLGLLMNEIFDEKNRLGVITVVHKPEGRNQEKFFGTSNEFMLVYARNKDKAKFNNVVFDAEQQSRYEEEDEKGKFRLKNFIRLTDGKYSLRANKPHFFYPIFVSKDLKRFSLDEKSGYGAVLPITNKGVERTWKTTKETFVKLASGGDIVAKKEEGGIVLYEKLREDSVIKTHWIKKEYHGYHFGTKLLETILGTKKFDFPKSIFLISDILRLTTKDSSTILDFFAGSGTTGHAILKLNEEDGGSRRFILCTNDENSIASEVCYPRIAKVIQGYKGPSGEKVAGLGGNLRYFRTAFVGAEPNDKNKEILTHEATEMLCMREDTFESVKETKAIKIFKNGKRHTGIVFDEDDIPALKKDIIKIGGVWSVYIFSLGDDTFDEEFADMSKVTVAPIPEAIMRVYRRIFQTT
ncbi:MAG: site-specific DNA-methyltransferase [Candidatus Taylorbacteria bacterium CG11_big_fil_rev_8_21_14_0_20_46_11]|uniref:Site-specific DNA-methyltransferase n=1 Tax=Candidatus Taylorbacteria bacterium CG11_big_fil_rev_8_21_14_0_20_46_11 TaxID=1975025 RepID=A0A2H0KCE1_9BACT|nr:MAG: site-specific DNA-methyltransferase [Candidatus Taylorbacteria bacterium CG11_big_fil_rev_8_21_14_0_20_46_11]